MFRKVLIANRGEIAVRIICACKELRVKTVAVYSQADKEALHTHLADEAICIGPPSSTESYLNIPSIISAAEVANVDAIHPGYGFLSENARFAEICRDCGITFIGPPPEVIKLMGDKVRAREKMAQTGLPILPGTNKVGESKGYTKLAKQIGFPLMIKAAGGGGGKGMRIVKSIEEFTKFIELAQIESEKVFGSSEVYLEKYLENPRHIEFQVLADNYGNIVHLGERECSIQRRHQKLIEEAPSTVLDDERRQAIGELVIKAMREINYSSLGTVEFLFDQRGRFYFIEMNTRVQVEHPVTETITSIDLVKEQIKMAAGQELELRQEQIKLNGHSIECRINAECPETFAPSPGVITFLSFPTGPGIRVDTAAYASASIPPYYDSLLAKVIAHGKDREEAIGRMNRALEMTRIEGVKTLIPLYQKIFNDPDFIRGHIGTSYLESVLSRPGATHASLP